MAVTEDVVLTVGRKKRKIRQLPHEQCEACGERIFGLEASLRIDAEILGRRRGRAA